MNVRVLLFAGLREKAGTGEISLELVASARVKDLREKLNLSENEWNPLAFAVNQVYAPQDTSLKEGDEVALIPPVAGG